MRHLLGISLVALVLSLPAVSCAQSTATSSFGDIDSSPTSPLRRLEFTLDGRVGMPSGTIRVDEKPVTGTRLHLRSDLGLDMSEAVAASVAYHFNASDAVRLSFLKYFLSGSTPLDREVTFNGPAFGPGRVDSDLGFYWLDLAYERTLHFDNGATVTGHAGLRYVDLHAFVNGNEEDFSRQELPVPIVGLRLTLPMGDRWGLTGDVSGGGLPRVDSLRKEGGTIFLTQTHVDAGVGITYALTPAVALSAGYHFMYFYQFETSHEDGNRIRLFDNGVQLGARVRF